MSILNGQELEKFVENGHLKNADLDNVNAGSIDLRLAAHIKIPKPSATEIDLAKGQKPQDYDIDLLERGSFLFTPGSCFRGSTMEEFNFPNDRCGLITGRPSTGRLFIDHQNAGWIDATYNGSNLTLEFVNQSPDTYVIRPGLSLVQMTVFTMAPVVERLSYAVKKN